MKEFLNILRRFVPPYKKYLALSILFNILSALLNIFSFAALIPILQILFQKFRSYGGTPLVSGSGPTVFVLFESEKAKVSFFGILLLLSEIYFDRTDPKKAESSRYFLGVITTFCP